MEKPQEMQKDLIPEPLRVEKKSRTTSRGLVHYHESYELTLFEHCDARVFMKDTWYEVHDGDVVFIPCNTLHRYQYIEIEQYTRIVISFQQDFVRRILTPLGCEELMAFYDGLRLHKATLAPGQFKQAYALGNRLLDACNHMNESPEHEAAGLATLLILLHELRPAFQSGQKIALVHRENQTVKQVINFIDAQYAGDIKLADLAGIAHVDKHYLCRLFKRHVGTTPVKYIQYRRIIESQKLLIYTGISIDTIAARCGFNNIQHFYKVFRSITGFSPVQYRTQRRSV